ncbi:MAG: hypothetical protein LBI30_00910 [Holosporales bacterium]|jgi:predicted RNA binding protein YcfA (HicA-like mRNA interferase family)|nr:hypothetical protein [Holosporales bacterium]
MKCNKIIWFAAALFLYSVDALASHQCSRSEAVDCCSRFEKSRSKHCKDHRKRNFKSVVKGANCAVYAMEGLKFYPFHDLSVWDKKYISQHPEVEDLLKKFIDGQHAASLKKLVFKSNHIVEVISTLEKSGFKHIKIDDDGEHHEHGKHRGVRKFYVHSDGGAVKIVTFKRKKDSGTKTIMKKMVLFNSESVSWKNVAFIVSNGGAPIPKSFKEGVRRLDDDDPDAIFGWKEMIFQESATGLDDQ